MLSSRPRLISALTWESPIVSTFITAWLIAASALREHMCLENYPARRRPARLAAPGGWSDFWGRCAHAKPSLTPSRARANLRRAIPHSPENVVAAAPLGHRGDTCFPPLSIPPSTLIGKSSLKPAIRLIHRKILASIFLTQCLPQRNRGSYIALYKCVILH